MNFCEAAGLTKIQFTHLAGIGHHTVSYGENKPRLDLRG